MPRGRFVGGLVIAATLAAAASMTGACGEKTTPKTPPAVVATADSISRVVTIEAPASSSSASSGATVPLNGHLFGSGPIGVVLAHMRPTDQSGWFPFATSAAATGRFTLLTFDFRGYGASGGQKDFTRLDTDLSAALAYMKTTLKLQQVFLVGANMGGTASLVLGAREPVAGIVSISSTDDFESLDALSAEPHISAPQLFIASQDDVPSRRSLEDFVKAAREPVEQQIYSGSAYGTNLFLGPHAAQVTHRIIAFLEAH